MGGAAVVVRDDARGLPGVARLPQAAAGGPGEGDVRAVRLRAGRGRAGRAPDPQGGPEAERGDPGAGGCGVPGLPRRPV